MPPLIGDQGRGEVRFGRVSKTLVFELGFKIGCRSLSQPELELSCRALSDILCVADNAGRPLGGVGA